MLGKHKQGFGSQVRKRAKQTLGTLNSQEYPPTKQPNTALQVPCVKVLTTAGSPGTQFQDTLRPEPPSLYDGSSPQHSKPQAAKFTRGPVHVSPCSTQRTQHNVRSSSCSKCETHNPASVFSLQSQITMSRRHSQNCDETPTADSHNTPNANKRTGSHVPHNHSKSSVRSIPSFPHTTIPSLTKLNQRAQVQFLARTTGSETS